MTAGFVLLGLSAVLLGMVSGSMSIEPSAVPPVVGGSAGTKRFAVAGRRAARSRATLVTPAQMQIAVGRVARSGKPLFCGGAKRYAALTFDDGPTPETRRLVRLLRRANVSGTFFTIGKRLESDPAAVKQMQSVGVIANHSWSHTAFTTLKPLQIRGELQSTQALLESDDAELFRLVRPPYGDTNAMVTNTLTGGRYAEALWSADSEDGLGVPWKQIASYAEQGIGPGAIILLHDGRETTLTALRKRILPAAQRSKLQFVTLPELLALNPPSAAQLAAGPRGCARAGTRNVTGLFFKRSEQLGYKP